MVVKGLLVNIARGHLNVGERLPGLLAAGVVEEGITISLIFFIMPLVIKSTDTTYTPDPCATLCPAAGAPAAGAGGATNGGNTDPPGTAP